MTNHNAISRGEEIARRLNAEYRATAELPAGGKFQSVDRSASISANLPLSTTSDWAQNREQSSEICSPPELSLLADMRDGEWLDAQTFDPLEYAIPGIIPEGLGLLVAPPKAGKSWLVAALGLAAAAGGTALGSIRVTKRPVLYLALEDGDRRLQDRFRKIMGGQGLIPKGMCRITKAHPNMAPGIAAEFLTLYSDAKPFIVIDTLAKVRPPKGAEDSYQADYQFMSRYKNIVDEHPGATILFVHHSRKAEAVDFIDSVSGTAGLAGAADFTLVLRRARQSEDAVLEVTGRDVAEGAYALTAKDGVLWQLDGADLSAASARVGERDAQRKLGDRSLDVLKLVTERAAADLSTKAADLAAIGIDENQRGVILNRLADGGYLTKTARGSFTTPVKTVKSVKTSESDGKGFNASNTFNTPPIEALCGCGEPLTTRHSRAAGVCAECAFIAAHQGADQ